MALLLGHQPCTRILWRLPASNPVERIECRLLQRPDAQSEPCPLCVTATSIASVGRIVYAARDAFSGGSALIDADLVTPRPLNVTIEGPLASSLALLGAALHLAFFMSHETGHSNALVKTYRDRQPELFPLAAKLIDLRLQGSLEVALFALDESS